MQIKKNFTGVQIFKIFFLQIGCNKPLNLPKIPSMKNLAFVMLLSLSFITSRAQNLYIPRDIKRAYNNGTRSITGIPATNTGKTTGTIQYLSRRFRPTGTLKVPSK